MGTLGQEFGIRRVYETTSKGDGVAVRLSDWQVDLGRPELALYEKVAENIPTVKAQKDVATELGMDEGRLQRLLAALEGAGLLYRADSVPATLSGVELHALFNKILPSWLDRGVLAPVLGAHDERQGSARLFTGWLIELYHYTRNANRHMPLSCAHTRDKPIKRLRAKHYAEEWNHYHYFMKSLKALGFTDDERRATRCRCR